MAEAIFNCAGGWRVEDTDPQRIEKVGGAHWSVKWLVVDSCW